MSDTFQLNNPQEVKAYISRESEFLNQYAELIQQEAQDLLPLENLINEAMQAVLTRKRGLTVAIEQTKSQGESNAQQQALSSLQKKLETYEAQIRTLAQCKDDLSGIRQDYALLIKDSTAIADASKILSTKIHKLIDKIINAF